MTLPTSIDKSTPAGPDSIQSGDDEIRALKLFIEDFFGIVDTNSYSAGDTFAFPMQLRMTEDIYLTWGGDNNGISANETSDFVRVKTGGSERLRINSSGIVGIGTTSPNASYILDARGWIRSQHPSGDASISIVAGNNTGNSILNLGDSDSDTVGRIIYNHTSNYLSLTTGASERLRIDSSGKVGIGTTSPDQTLHVYRGSAGAIAANSSSGIVVEDDTNIYIQMLCPNTDLQGILFGDEDDVDVGFIEYGHSTNYLRFAVNASERLRIDSSGNIGIGTTSPTSGYMLDARGWIRAQHGSGDVVIAAIAGNNTGNSIIRLGDSDSDTPGSITYNHTGNYMAFATNASEVLRLDSSGNLVFAADTDTYIGHPSGNVIAITSSSTQIFSVDSSGVDITGSLGASTTITAGTGLTVTTGDIAVSNGDVGITGSIFVNETANTFGTYCITVNQGAANDNVIAFKSSVSHGMTSIAEADTWGYIQKAVSLNGGMHIGGLSAISIGVHIVGMVGTPDTTDTTSSIAPVMLTGRVKSGTSVGTMGDTDNIAVIRNNATTRWLIKGNGDIHASDTDGATGLDEYDDISLLRAVETSRGSAGIIKSKWDEFVKYNHDDLINIGVLSPDGPDGSRGLINLTTLRRLHNGAIWQLYMLFRELEQRLNTLEAA